ncbi:MAG: putative toxin-antitoxin system toxin component, PIN family [Lysobacteraceae bacterium]
MQANRSQSDTPARLVLDTNVWLDVLLFDDPHTARLRDLADASRLLLLATKQTRAEWRRVLDYPQLAVDAATQQRLCEAYDALAFQMDDFRPVVPCDPALPRCRDPDDQMFLELAACSGAAAVLTRDNALLALDRRCRRAAGFAVCRPQDWLAMTIPEPS